MKCLADALIVAEHSHAASSESLMEAYGLMVRVGVSEANEPVLEAAEQELERRGIDLDKIGAE